MGDVGRRGGAHRVVSRSIVTHWLVSDGKSVPYTTGGGLSGCVEVNE